MLAGLVCGLIAGAIIYATPRKYIASITLSTISAPPKSISIGGGLGSLLSGASMGGGGGGANPALIVRISGEYGVLYRVAHSPMYDGGKEVIIDRLRSTRRGSLPDNMIVKEMRKIAHAGFDKSSGVIVVSAQSKDTALARAITLRLVEETSTTFVALSHAQGTEMRKAMDRRVDSAKRQLFTAEEMQRQFLEGNRASASFSLASLEGKRLSQAVDLARDVYKQAVGDREGAVAKELEATPAVVVVDEIPAVIPPEPRYLAFKALGTAILGSVIFGLLLLIRESTRRAANSGDSDAIRLAESARQVRILGPLLGWLFPMPDKDRYDLSVKLAEPVTVPGSKRLTS